MHRLPHKSLQFPGTIYGEFVLMRKFLHPQNSNDVLEFFVFLEYLLDSFGSMVMLHTYDIRSQYRRSTIEWVYCRIDSFFCQCTIEDDRRVDM